MANRERTAQAAELGRLGSVLLGPRTVGIFHVFTLFCGPPPDLCIRPNGDRKSGLPSTRGSRRAGPAAARRHLPTDAAGGRLAPPAEAPWLPEIAAPPEGGATPSGEPRVRPALEGRRVARRRLRRHAASMHEGQPPWAPASGGRDGRRRCQTAGQNDVDRARQHRREDLRLERRAVRREVRSRSPRQPRGQPSSRTRSNP